MITGRRAGKAQRPAWPWALVLALLASSDLQGQAFGGGITQRALGPMLRVEPDLVSEGGAFVVSIPRQRLPDEFQESDLALAMEEVGQQRAIDTLGTQTRWQFYPARIDGERFVAEMQGLHGHRVQFGVAR